MEDPLINLIRQSAVINDTRPLKEFICLQSKTSLNIDDNTLNCLQSIVRDGTIKMNRVQCVLSCIRYFYEQNLNQNIWDKLANKFAELCVMCLNECVGFSKKYDEVEDVLIYLSEIVSELLNQSEFIAKTIHYLMVPPLIRVITTENFSFEAIFSLVRTLSCIVKSSTKDDHSKINPNLKKDIANYANWILMCGDYETQTIILETLLYILSGIDNKEEFCADWFNLYPRIKTDFFNRDFLDFEPESRLFLNLVNKLNKKPQVYSLGCICVFSDGTKLQKPNDSNYLVFWVDFNIYSESVVIYFQGTADMWEIFQLYNKNVLEVCSNSSEYSLNNRMTPIVKLCFNMSCDSIDVTAKYVEIWFEISEDFHNLENSFLIPVYGFRYVCNWKASMSNSILSNEVLSSEISRSADRNICLRKYTPLSVVITPIKSTLDQPQLDSSISRQSDHREILESNHNIMESDTVNSDEGSCDEIISTPNIAPVKNLKKILANIQENKTNVSSPRLYQSSYKGGKKKQIIQSFSNEKNQKEVSLDNLDKENKTDNESVQKINRKEVSPEIHNKENSMNINSTTSLQKTRNEKRVDLQIHDNVSSPRHYKSSYKGGKKKQIIQSFSNEQNEKEVSLDNHDKENKTHNESVQKINRKEVSPEVHNKENSMNIKSTTSLKKTRNEERVNLQIHDKKSEKNKYSDLHPLKRTNKSVKENELKNNVDSTKRRKLFHSQDNYQEYTLNSPLYDSSQKNTQKNESQLMTDRSENVMPKVTYSYRTYKQTKLASPVVWNFENETEFPITQQKRNINKFTVKEKSPKAMSTDNKRFFTNEQSAAIGLSLSQTPKAFNSNTKSIYSDFSSETLKPVKKVYSKPRNLKKKQQERKTVLQIASSDSDPDFVPVKSKPVTRSKTRLEQNIDPLRFKNKESNNDHLHINELPVKTVIEQKEIGKHIFTVYDNAKESFLPTENLYVQHEDNDPNGPFIAKSILTTQNKDSPKKCKLNPVEEKPLKSKQPSKRNNMQLPFKNDNPNECDEQNVDEFYSDHEVQDIQAIKRKKALLLKEDHLSKFGKLILKNLAKNIEESQIIIKNEREKTYAKFISDMETLKENTASLSVDLDKCKKVLVKTNNEIDKTIKRFTKCTSNHMTKSFALVPKYAKDFESEMGQFAKGYIENMKK